MMKIKMMKMSKIMMMMTTMTMSKMTMMMTGSGNAHVEQRLLASSTKL